MSDGLFVGMRSSFSLLRGIFSPEEIVARARNKGWETVGILDINNFYGLIRFLQAARDNGVRPLAGAVLEINGRALCSAFVRNAAGFHRLCELLSLILVDTTGRTYFPESDPAAWGVTVRNSADFGASEPGRTNHPALRGGTGRRESVCPIIGKTDDHAPALTARVTENLIEKGWEGLSLASDDALFLERLAGRTREGLYVKLTWGKPFARLAGWAQERGYPCLALVESAAETKEHAERYSLLRAIDLCVNIASLPAKEELSRHLLIPAPGEVSAFFSAVPQALRETKILAVESATAGIMSDTAVFPRFRGLGDDEAFLLLKSLCLKGVSRRYGKLTEAVRQRLDYELDIIREKGFSSYFLVVRDIVLRCSRTCGRGSAAASIVSYLLGITHIDPLRYNLFFERFLNRGRKDPPDIDVDFPWDEREKALAYVFERYRGRVGMVADHVTFGPRSALREPAKAEGMAEDEIKRLVEYYLAGVHDRIPARLLAIAETLRGTPRYIGTHPGGVVITPGPITNHTHVQISPLGYPVIAWEKDATEDAGLVKIDLLGNRSLAVLRDAIRLVNLRHRAGLDWRRFDPLADQATERFIASGNTVGIFYIESPATRQLLIKMRQADYESLVIASSIIRPAANRYIEEFVKRLHGKPYRPLHPLLSETLQETFGIMVYQEDVSRVAIALAGFAPDEADRLRKVLSKKAGRAQLEQFRRRFFEGARRAGMMDADIGEVWDMILSFDGYSFCKAHSASYAQVSYRLAYLKRLFPLEFMAAVINNGGGFYTRQTYLDEVRRMGFRILSPDINASGLDYTVEEGALRVGLGQLCRIKRPFVEKIYEERARGGLYRDFFDLLRRTEPGPLEISVLIRSGTLDSISNGHARPRLFFLYFQRDRFDNGFFPPEMPEFIRDYTAATKLRDEVETLGLVISRHPLSIFASRIRRWRRAHPGLPVVDSARIGENRGRRVAIAGTIVTGKQVRTRHGASMMFVSFADEQAIFETVFFPAAYERFRFVLSSAAAFLVIGEVKDDLGALAIHVEELIRLTRSPDRLEEEWKQLPTGEEVCFVWPHMVIDTGRAGRSSQ